MSGGKSQTGGIGPAGFPSTLWTTVLGARDRASPDFAKSLGQLVELYWKPVYWVIRRQWGKSNDDAKDLTQEFFASFLEKDRLKNVGPEKGRFRAYVSAVLMNFLRDKASAERALKRGGRVRTFSMDVEEDDLPVSAAVAPEALLDRAWALDLLARARADLSEHYHRSGRGSYAEVFERHELSIDPPTCAQIAAQLGLAVHDVENHLKHARATFARLLRARVRETVADDGDLDEELRYLSEVIRLSP